MEKDLLDAQPGEELRIWVSFLEIYNEAVRDLLSPTKEPTQLKVMEQPNIGICMPGLIEVVCKATHDVDELIDFGTKKRVTASTNMNATSSRSHAVMIIKLQRLIGPTPRDAKADNECRILNSKINFVDLAGSERMSKAGTSGHRRKEGGAINKSLSALGMVIKELSNAMIRGTPKAETRNFVSFRSSSLTFLLKNSLAGNSKTCMVATISPTSDDLGETLSTLRFASNVKLIKTVAKVNMDEKDMLIQSLQEEIARLKKRLENGDGKSDDEESDVVHWEKLLDGMQVSYEDELQSADSMMRKRTESLEHMGLRAVKEISESSAMSDETPLLQNLSDDPTLMGCLVYFLRTGPPTLIGASEDCTIELSGLGIPDKLCEIRNEDNANLTITLWEGAPEDTVDVSRRRVTVNGDPLKSGQSAYVLKHHDIIHLGWAFRMRLVIPRARRGGKERTSVGVEDFEEDGVPTFPRLEDTEAAMDFYMVLQDLYDLPKIRRSAFLKDLTEAAHLVDEANVITQRMRPNEGLSLRIELIKDIHHDTHDLFFVCLVKKQVPAGADSDGEFDAAMPSVMVTSWTYLQFKERIELMRDCFDIFFNTGCWSGAGDPFEDPWMVPSLSDLRDRMSQATYTAKLSTVQDDLMANVMENPRNEVRAETKNEEQLRHERRAKSDEQSLSPRGSRREVASSTSKGQHAKNDEQLRSETRTELSDDTEKKDGNQQGLRGSYREVIPSIIKEQPSHVGPSVKVPPALHGDLRGSDTGNCIVWSAGSLPESTGCAEFEEEDEPEKEDLYNPIQVMQLESSLREQQRCLCELLDSEGHDDFDQEEYDCISEGKLEQWPSFASTGLSPGMSSSSHSCASATDPEHGAVECLRAELLQVRGELEQLRSREPELEQLRTLYNAAVARCQHHEVRAWRLGLRNEELERILEEQSHGVVPHGTALRPAVPGVELEKLRTQRTEMVKQLQSMEETAAAKIWSQEAQARCLEERADELKNRLCTSWQTEAVLRHELAVSREMTRLRQMNGSIQQQLGRECKDPMPSVREWQGAPHRFF